MSEMFDSADIAMAVENTECTAAQPAAPTLTPWADKRAVTVVHRGFNNIWETQQVYAEFARRLEALVHQQQEALCEAHYHTPLIDAALAAYAALKKEIERG